MDHQEDPIVVSEQETGSPPGQSAPDRTFSLNESQGERFLGIVTLIFGLALRFLIIPTQIKNINVPFPTPRTVPLAYAYGLIILGVCLYVSGFFGRSRPNQKDITFSVREFKLVGFTLLMLAVCIILFPFLHYIPTTALVIAVMMLVFGHKNKIVIACTAIIMPVCTYFFFVNLLKMIMP